MPSSFMQDVVQRELLRYAVGRAITCDCGKILDMNDAVLYAPDEGKTAVGCGHCWDASMVSAAVKYGKGTNEIAELLANGDENAIVDGRTF